MRSLGTLTFLLLRDYTGIVQVTAKKGEVAQDVIDGMLLPKESVVAVRGKVKASSVAKKGFEIVPSGIENLNPLSTMIPFEVTGKVPAEIDTRLNYRYIDLRRLEPHAIFNIESTVLSAFRDTMTERGFTEIRTPSVVAESTEGGADLFSVKYFERDAYLAQSPQLYKQLSVIGGIEKVFMTMPVFRAEKSNTTYHLTESTQMDIEMAFADDSDAVELLGSALTRILTRVKEKNAADLDALKVGVEVPTVKEITYTDALKLLDKNDLHIEFGEDLNREAEQALCKLLVEAVIVRKYPTKVRAFYSMPDPKNPELSNSYDLLYRGLEVSSGAQRIHIPDMLVQAIEKRGMDPKSFESYIYAFKCGAPPHSGWSIGLERLAMQITKSENIRECSLFPRDRKRLTP